MTGDERKRYCKQCSLNVYNISDMSEDEANKFLTENEDACVRFYVRKDGTIKTQSCAKFLKDIRYKFALLQAAVSFLALFLISACTGNHSKWPWEKNNWQAVKERAKERYYNPDKYFLMAGRPTYSDLRKAMKVLSPDYREYFYYKNPAEEKLLNSFRQRLLHTRTIEDSELRKLKAYYKHAGDDYGLFNAHAVEMLLEFEKPIPEKKMLKMGKTFEAERQRVMDGLIQKAEKAILENKQIDAEIFLEHCTRTGLKSSKQTAKSTMLPEGVEIFQFPEIMYNEPEYIVATRDKVNRLIHLWKKVNPSHPSLMQRRHCLEYSLINKDLESAPDNEELLKARESIRQEMIFILDTTNISHVALVKIVDIEGELASQNTENKETAASIRVKMKPVENFKGSSTDSEFIYDYPTRIKKNRKKVWTGSQINDYLDAGAQLLPPKIGDLKIVFSRKFKNSKGETFTQSYEGILDGTRKNIDHVKRIVETQNRYHGEYDLSPRRKKYWDRDLQRQKDELLHPANFFAGNL